MNRSEEYIKRYKICPENRDKFIIGLRNAMIEALKDSSTFNYFIGDVNNISSRLKYYIKSYNYSLYANLCLENSWHKTIWNFKKIEETECSEYFIKYDYKKELEHFINEIHNIPIQYCKDDIINLVNEMIYFTPYQSDKDICLIILPLIISFLHVYDFNTSNLFDIISNDKTNLSTLKILKNLFVFPGSFEYPEICEKLIDNEIRCKEK